jgi:DNA-binding GntR family transcriptional regulator
VSIAEKAAKMGDVAARIAPIQRVTLHGAVVNQLRDMIIEGALAPGARINEVQIGASLGVSRTPLREAIKTLASEGLVEMQPARGAVVRRFTQEDVRDILEALKIIEQACAVLACARADDAQIGEIAALHEDMMRLYAARDRLAYFKLNQAIHTALVKAGGNAALAEAHEQLQARIKRVRFVGNETPDRWAGAAREHEEMIAALRAREGAALASVMGRHLDNTIERVRDVLP